MSNELIRSFLEPLTVNDVIFKESIYIRAHPLFNRAIISGCSFSEPDDHTCLTVLGFDDSNRVLFKNRANSGVTIKNCYLRGNNE